MKLVDLIGYAADDNVRAFLRVIREGESSQTDDAYRMRFGGELIDPGLAWHPGGTVKRLVHGKAIESSACGAYQFLARTWEGVAHEVGLANFGPASQDLAAIYLIARRGALQDVLAGNLEDAVRKCSGEWASLPGSPYGQPTLTMERARAVYEQWGGRYGPAQAAPAPTVDPTPGAPPAAPTQAADPLPPVTETGIDLSQPRSKPVLPILTAVLPSIVSAIPDLVRVFGSGSEVATRNAAAAQKVAEVVTRATGAVNVQDAAEKIAADPVAREAARAAVQAEWWAIVGEAGGGGIEAARKADAAFVAAGESVWKSPSFWVALMILPVVYIVLVSILFPAVGGQWAPDIRGTIAGSAISLVLGSVCGYYFGAMTSRNRPSA